jgi:hydrogenase-4 component B
VQRDVPFLSIVPIAEARSSYNGLLVFLFIVFSGTAAATVIHHFASDRLRRAPAWDCGYPDPSPRTQYTASSFAQPIRRVFGTLAFRARERVEMPPPGSVAPARIAVRLTDVIWDTLYAPVAGAVEAIAARINQFQYLSIRRYLSFVFAALVGILLVLAIWS